jgi:hypothetical protein
VSLVYFSQRKVNKKFFLWENDGNNISNTNTTAYSLKKTYIVIQAHNKKKSLRDTLGVKGHIR